MCADLVIDDRRELLIADSHLPLACDCESVLLLESEDHQNLVLRFSDCVCSVAWKVLSLLSSKLGMQEQEGASSSVISVHQA